MTRQMIYTVRQKKETTFHLRINLFNMQCNLTKFSTLIVSVSIMDANYLVTGMYTNFRRLLCKKCDVGYYVINHGVMRD